MAVEVPRGEVKNLMVKCEKFGGNSEQPFIIDNSTEIVWGNSICWILKKEPNFSTIGGLVEQKRFLSELVKLPSKFPEVAKIGYNMPKGILFTGPPGTGKTLIAKVQSIHLFFFIILLKSM